MSTFYHRRGTIADEMVAWTILGFRPASYLLFLNLRRTYRFSRYSSGGLKARKGLMMVYTAEHETLPA